jgi:hypothetical protein
MHWLWLVILASILPQGPIDPFWYYALDTENNTLYAVGAAGTVQRLIDADDTLTLTRWTDALYSVAGDGAQFVVYQNRAIPVTSGQSIQAICLPYVLLGPEEPERRASGTRVDVETGTVTPLERTVMPTVTRLQRESACRFDRISGRLRYVGYDGLLNEQLISIDVNDDSTVTLWSSSREMREVFQQSDDTGREWLWQTLNGPVLVSANGVLSRLDATRDTWGFIGDALYSLTCAGERCQLVINQLRLSYDLGAIRNIPPDAVTVDNRLYLAVGRRFYLATPSFQAQAVGTMIGQTLTFGGNRYAVLADEDQTALRVWRADEEAITRIIALPDDTINIEAETLNGGWLDVTVQAETAPRRFGLNVVSGEVIDHRLGANDQTTRTLITYLPGGRVLFQARADAALADGIYEYDVATDVTTPLVRFEDDGA